MPGDGKFGEHLDDDVEAAGFEDGVSETCGRGHELADDGADQRASCRCSGGERRSGQAPARLIELVAWVVASKFAWQMPLNRQTQRLAGYGVDLDRSTLVHWVDRTA